MCELTQGTWRPGIIWWTLLLPKATCERGGKRVLLMMLIPASMSALRWTSVRQP